VYKRQQKFNTHLRRRPEALAARVQKAADLDQAFPSVCGAFSKMRKDMHDTVDAVIQHNAPKVHGASALLPMAFAEGSPMHPTYGARHATVAGACTTIVKAFFDTSTILGANADPGCGNGKDGFYRNISCPVTYYPIDSGARLKRIELSGEECPLTLEGELNKLAANISIGGNLAGVHYCSDYSVSLRMGEAIAIGMLEEQALC